jgi:4-amino-4-deoxy-L-arabinose transferase-like glycosyltransferase
VSTFSYAWGIGNVNLEPFYGAAARSMSMSWHNFVFGAVDPWGTVSVDKLPGALWVQALSLRVFGFHLWAIVLPQVVEGSLTVLVLYRAVRRLAGCGAGIMAAAVLAVSPATILLDRGNISDSLLILLLVLAADACSSALVSGRVRSLVGAGVWVGLAFQTKMMQAWLVLPALYLVYLVAAPTASLLRRFGHVALSAGVVLVVSLSWMTAVSAVPAHDRPYVDGSCDNSLFSQVFVYNGVERISHVALHQAGCSKPSSFQQKALDKGLARGLNSSAIHAGWDRLLKGVFGRDDAWVVLPAIVAAAAILIVRRKRPRTDRIRAAAILWSTWLVLHGVFFSAGRYLNPYYVAALIPPIAVLFGLGVTEAWRRRHAPRTIALVGLSVFAGALYDIVLVPGHAGIRGWVVGSTVVVSALAVVLLLATYLQRHRGVRVPALGMVASVVALLIGSGWSSASVVMAGLGPFDSPYEPASVIYYSQTLPQQDRLKLVPYVKDVDRFNSNQSVDVYQGSAIAGFYILMTGKEYLPIGGFTGQVPAPTLPAFIRLVHEGKITIVTAAVSPLSSNPDMVWVTEHCDRLRASDGYRDDGTTFRRFDCLHVQPQVHSSLIGRVNAR